VVLGKRPSHRPRKKGAKLPAPQAVVAATAQRKKLNVSWYGGGRRNVEIVSGTAQWYKSGAVLIPVLWVFVHDLTGTHRDTYLFTTDLSMTVSRIIETYTGRWNIETTFQELRAYLVWLAISNARNSPCMFCKPPAHGLIRPSPFKGMSVTFVVLGPGGGNMGDELFPARPRSSLEVSVPEGVIEDLGLV
jgi:hypothetical protein